MRHSILLSALLSISLLAANLQAGPVMSGLMEWYQSTNNVLNSGNNPAGSGDGVATWGNLVAGGPNVTQSTAAQQPTYNPTGFNGHPALVFSNQVLDNLTTNAVPDNSSRTVFVVAQESSAAGGTLFTSRTSAPVDTMQQLDIDPTHYVYSDGKVQNITTPNGPGLSGFVADYIQSNSLTGSQPTETIVGSLAVQLNGVSETLDVPNGVRSESAGATGFSIGNRLDNGGIGLGQGWTGDIAAVLVYDRVLTPAEINQTGYYLASTFGVQTTFTPEPSSIVLLLLGVAGLWRCTRRKEVT